MEIKPGRDKQEIVKKLLEQEHLLIHINPRAAGVEVPEGHKKGPVLTLKLSYRFQGRMDITPEKISAMLLFNGEYFDCQIPWDAIWGCSSVDGKNFLWPENLDPTTLSGLNLGSVSSKQSESKTDEPPKPTKPNLKRIK